MCVPINTFVSDLNEGPVHGQPSNPATSQVAASALKLTPDEWKSAVTAMKAIKFDKFGAQEERSSSNHQRRHSLSLEIRDDAVLSGSQPVTTKEEKRIEKLISEFTRTVSFVRSQMEDMDQGELKNKNLVALSKLVDELLSDDETKLDEYLARANIVDMKLMIEDLRYIQGALKELNRANTGVFSTLAKGIRALIHFFTFKKLCAPAQINRTFDLTQLDNKVNRVQIAYYNARVNPNAWKLATETTVKEALLASVDCVAAKAVDGIDYAADKAINGIHYAVGMSTGGIVHFSKTADKVASKVAGAGGMAAYGLGLVMRPVQYGYFSQKVRMGGALRDTARLLKNDAYATSLPVRYGYQMVKALPGAILGAEVKESDLSPTEKVGQDNAKAIVEFASKPVVKYPTFVGGALVVGFIASSWFNSK